MGSGVVEVVTRDIDVTEDPPLPEAVRTVKAVSARGSLRGAVPSHAEGRQGSRGDGASRRIANPGLPRAANDRGMRSGRTCRVDEHNGLGCDGHRARASGRPDQARVRSGSGEGRGAGGGGAIDRWRESDGQVVDRLDSHHIHGKDVDGIASELTLCEEMTDGTVFV
jgi:hypothetical protein